MKKSRDNESIQEIMEILDRYIEHQLELKKSFKKRLLKYLLVIWEFFYILFSFNFFSLIQYLYLRIIYIKTQNDLIKKGGDFSLALKIALEIDEKILIEIGREKYYSKLYNIVYLWRMFNILIDRKNFEIFKKEISLVKAFLKTDRF